MNNLVIPEDLRELYSASCNPDDDRYSAVTATLIERIAIYEAADAAVWEAIHKFCNASEKQAIWDHVMAAQEKRAHA